MAIHAKVSTLYGEDRTLYIRLNSIMASNHGENAEALFRGFISKDAFENKAHYIYEHAVSFKANIEKPLWEQAYEALCTELAIDNIQV